jgi:ADP-dependent NAD(P)H-hydrate dehydratase
MARAEGAAGAAARARAITPALLRAHPLGQAAPHADKEQRGRVLVIGGGRGAAGAVRLSGEAALRAGAGKLQIATARSAASALTVAVPEALVIELSETRSGGIRASAARELQPRCAQADAVLVGPGMMDEAAAAKLVARLTFDATAMLVLDAGAIGACVDGRHAFPPATVITPHDGELQKLAQGLGLDCRAETRSLAATVAVTCGVICVAKGPTTWIATPDGALFRHDCAIPGLGMSGSGDVLAGLLTGLAARSGNALHAALWAVCLHAAAGQALEKRIGRLGFLARELAPEIPRLLPA